MPLIDLTYPAGTFTPETRTALVDDLTTVLLRAERAPDTEFFRSIAWVHVHELPSGTMLAAGRPVTEPNFRVQVTIPQGALSDRRKQELVAEATRVVLEAAGLTDADALRVWVLINEVPDGNWGAGGQIIRFAQLLQYAAQEREQPGSASVEPEPATSSSR
jgi:4-oxalocrotonate tautomerase family enzyme